jgi:hypothetical protein
MAVSDSDSSVSDPLDNRNDDGWEDVEPDDEPLTVVSLFDEKTFPNVVDMLHYCKDKYSFDMWAVRKELGEHRQVTEKRLTNRTRYRFHGLDKAGQLHSIRNQIGESEA